VIGKVKAAHRQAREEEKSGSDMRGGGGKSVEKGVLSTRKKDLENAFKETACARSKKRTFERTPKCSL